MGALFSGILSSLGSLFGAGSAAGAAASTAGTVGASGLAGMGSAAAPAAGAATSATVPTATSGLMSGLAGAAQAAGGTGPQPTLSGAATNKLLLSAGQGSGGKHGRQAGEAMIANAPYTDMSQPSMNMQSMLGQLSQSSGPQQGFQPMQQGGNQYVNSLLAQLMNRR